MDNTYTLFGFDAKRNTVPITEVGLNIASAHKFARNNGVGSFFITPSTHEQFPDYRTGSTSPTATARTGP